MSINFQHNNKDYTINLIEGKTSDLTVVIHGVTYSVMAEDEQVGLVKKIFHSISLDSLTSQEDLSSRIGNAQGVSSSKTHTAGLNALRKVETQDLSVCASKMDSYLYAMQQEACFTGSVIVAQENKVLLAKGYGKASQTSSNTPSTPFHIASVGKQFTAAAIMKLQEQRKIDVKQAINTYLPREYQSQKWETVTVHHLLSHTAGIHKPVNSTTVNKMIQEAGESDLDFEPGTDYSYSNVGYYLLGKMIEHVSALPYRQFIKTELFIPAGMRSSDIDDEGYLPSENAAIGYRLNEEGTSLNENEEKEPLPLFSAGGVISSVEDLFLWSRILDGESPVLNKESIKQMTTPSLGKYGYSLIITENAGQKILSYKGGISGFDTVFCKYSDGVFISVLCNSNHIDSAFIQNKLTAIVQNPMKNSAQVIPFSPNFNFFPYVGTFHSKSHPDLQFTFSVNDSNQLILKHGEDPPCKGVLLSNGCIQFLGNWNFTIESQRDGTVTVYSGFDEEPIDSLENASPL